MDLATRVAQRVSGRPIEEGLTREDGTVELIAERVASRFVEGRGTEGKTIVGDDVRITVGTGRSEMVIVVQQLPSKPLKRKLDRLFYNGLNLSERYWHPSFRGESGGYESIGSTTWMFGAENIAKWAGFSSGSTFKSAEAGLKKALAKGVKEMTATYKKVISKGTFVWDSRKKENVPAGKKELAQALKWLEDGSKYAIDEGQIFYLEVEPHDYEPISVAGDGWGGTFEWGSFSFASHEQDEYMQQMEGQSTSYKSSSAGGARKAFKLLKGDPTSVKSMGLDEFTSFLDKNKIAYDYIPTVWR